MAPGGLARTGVSEGPAGFVKDGGADLSPHRFTPALGERVTVTVEPERVTGDWFVAIYPSPEG